MNNLNKTNLFDSTKSIITNSENRPQLFWYCIVFIVVVYFISNINTDLNFIFGVGCGIAIIWLLMHNNRQAEIKQNEIEEKKINAIRPFPKNAGNDVLNYLFSIQDFYEYNPQAYEDMVEQIDQFFERYDETTKDNSLAGVNYELMKSYQANIINSLHSIIFKLIPNKQYDKKLEHAIKAIRQILDGYLDKIIYINNKYIFNTGIKNTTKFISKSTVQPINMYDDEFATYQIV